MKISALATQNSIKLLSGLANNDDSLAAMVIKDWIGDGATVYTYKKNGGKDDAREKAIEEFGTGAIWLFAIPAIKKIIDFAIYPLFKLNSKFDPRLLDNKENLKTISKIAQGEEKALFDNLNNFNPVLKKFTNAQMYKGFAIGKFAIATSIAAFALGKIIKYKQKTTTDRIKKDNKADKISFNSKTIENAVNENKKFDRYINNSQISFKGGLSEFMYNPIKNTMILDGVITATRLKEARKEERLEVAFKELCQIVFIYGLAKPIQLGFEKIGELMKTPIKLDPKNLFTNNLKELIEQAKPSINELKNSKNIVETLSNTDVKSPIMTLLQNEGLISLTKDKKALSVLKPIDESAIKNALNNFENMQDNIGNLKQSKIFKAVAVIANILIAAGIMGVIQPKLTIFLRKIMYGTNENPAIAQEEKRYKNEIKLL